VAVKRAVFGAEMRMQTCRWTEVLQMLEVTTRAVSRSHNICILIACSSLRPVEHCVK